MAVVIIRVVYLGGVASLTSVTCQEAQMSHQLYYEMTSMSFFYVVVGFSGSRAHSC